MSTDPTKSSQCDLILNYMLRGNSITPITALKLFGCFRLGARIYDLEIRGWWIDRKMIRLKNKKWVCCYSNPVAHYPLPTRER